METTTIVSPFLRLPPELRLRIYEHLLIASWPVTFWKDDKDSHFRPNLASRLHPEIMRANKLILNEASDVLYGRNIFKSTQDIFYLEHVVPAYNKEYQDQFSDFLETIGCTNRGRIRNVHLYVHGWYDSAENFERLEADLRHFAKRNVFIERLVIKLFREFDFALGMPPAYTSSEGEHRIRTALSDATSLRSIILEVDTAAGEVVGLEWVKRIDHEINRSLTKHAFWYGPHVPSQIDEL